MANFQWRAFCAPAVVSCNVWSCCQSTLTRPCILQRKRTQSHFALFPPTRSRQKERVATPLYRRKNRDQTNWPRNFAPIPGGAREDSCQQGNWDASPSYLLHLQVGGTSCAGFPQPITAVTGAPPDLLLHFVRLIYLTDIEKCRQCCSIPICRQSIPAG